MHLEKKTINFEHDELIQVDNDIDNEITITNNDKLNITETLTHNDQNKVEKDENSSNVNK